MCGGILYFQTDSLIYVHPADENPLSIGPHLGDLTDEYPQVIENLNFPFIIIDFSTKLWNTAVVVPSSMA